MLISENDVKKGKCFEVTRYYPRMSELFTLIFCLCSDRRFEAPVKKQYADHEIIIGAVVGGLIILILSCILYLR